MVESVKKLKKIVATFICIETVFVHENCFTTQMPEF